MEKSESFYSSGSYGCVYYPRINCSSKTIKKTNMISKVSLIDFYSQNEYNIAKKLKKISNLKNDPFLYIQDKCGLKKKQILYIKRRAKCPVLEKKRKNKKFIIFYLKYIKSKEVSDYFFNHFTLKHFFRYYSFMIKHLNILKKNDIIHKDLHMGNVLIDNTKNFHIIDFGLSIDKTQFYLKNGKLNYTYLKYIFLSFDPTWKYWSIENHILCFFIYKNEKLTEKTLKNIIDQYYTNNDLFKQIYKNMSNYKKKVFDFYKNLFINNDNIETHIRLILEQSSKTWDLYQLNYNVLYLLIKLDIKHIDSFKQYIMEGLHYDYKKRPTTLEIMKFIYEILKKYDAIKMTYKYNTFLNNIKKDITMSAIKLINE